MGMLSQLVGTEATVEHKGTTYKLSPCKIEIQAQYEQWLEDRAWDALERRKPRMTTAAYQEAVSQLEQDIATDKYGWFSQACVDSQTAGPLSKGFRHLLYLRLKDANPDITPALVLEILGAAWEELAAKARRMDHDPNSPSPDKPGEPGA